MPYFAGIDIGSRGAKGCIIEDGKIVSYFIGDTGPESGKPAWYPFEGTAKPVGLEVKDMTYVVATGYGRVLVPFANENISEISCHAKGAQYCLPSVRTILDMGGQDCKAINVNEKGVVTKFIMNDKCAGGTGRFLEVIASVLGLTIEQIGPVALTSTEKFPFNTVCAVFTITGGIPKNTGMVAKMKEKLGLEPVLMEPDPQIAGALGAAVFARERWLAKPGQPPPEGANMP